MQIFVKSFGGVRLYFSGEGKEGERLSRGIPLFCKRDIARRMQASRAPSCRPNERCLPAATGRPAIRPHPTPDAPPPLRLR